MCPKVGFRAMHLQSLLKAAQGMDPTTLKILIEKFGDKENKE